LFTVKQSKRIIVFTMASVTVAALAAVGYSLIFGNPGAAPWASIFILPSWVVITLCAGVLSSAVRWKSGSTLAGVAAGVFVGACLLTVSALLFLRLIVELDDSMGIDGISSVPMYAWIMFRDFGLSTSAIFYLSLWLLWSVFQIMRIRCLRSGDSAVS
jgi:hypothetical protein